MTAAMARPYVAAAFEYALAHQEVSAWEAMLQSAALIAEDARVALLLQSPKVTEEQLSDLFCGILAPMLNTERKNFLFLLAERNRLALLPEMAEMFKVYRAAQEKTITVDVTSAIALDEAYKQTLMQALAVRLQRQVNLQCEVDPDLIGGAVIRAGDTVIDGSIRGKLARLVDFI